MAKESMADQLARKFVAECRFFTGIQNVACEAGVQYRSVRDASGDGPFRWPCLTLTLSGRPCTTTCPKRSTWTAEEARAKAEESEAHTVEFLRKLGAGICPTCNATVEKKRQVDRCVYADPCGHRLYQGQV